MPRPSCTTSVTRCGTAPGGLPQGGGASVISASEDGTSSLADTVENTATPFGNYPRARVTFDGEVMTMEAQGDAVPPECRTATYQVQVIRHGATPVALVYQPIEDACVGRVADLRTPLIWVAE